MGYIIADNVRSTPKKWFKEEPSWDFFITYLSDSSKWEEFKGHSET